MSTPRINEAMHLLSTGLTPPQVAERMTVTTSCVHVYTHSYKHATGTATRRDAIRHYLRSNGIADPHGTRSIYATLPRRLRQVADLVVAGAEYGEIAPRLGMRRETVYVYLHRLYERFRVDGWTALVERLQEVKA